MKRLLLAVLVFTSISAFGQATRYDGYSFTSNYAPSGSYPAVLAASGSKIDVCSSPVDAVPCTNHITTYTDSTAVTACDDSTQVTLSGTNSCVSSSDKQGNFGFWYNTSESIAYTITQSTGKSYGPFIISGVNSTYACTNAYITDFNPVCYGAKAGTEASHINSMTAFQAAIDAACASTSVKSVTVPAGEFWLWQPVAATEGLHINSGCSGLKFHGSGKFNTILHIHGYGDAKPQDSSGNPVCEDVHTVSNPDLNSSGSDGVAIYWNRIIGLTLHGGLPSLSCSGANPDCTSKNTQATSLNNVEISDLTLDMGNVLMDYSYPLHDSSGTYQDPQTMWSQNYASNTSAGCWNSWDTSGRGIYGQADYYFDNITISGVRIENAMGEGEIFPGANASNIHSRNNDFYNIMADGISSSGGMDSINDSFNNILHASVENYALGPQTFIGDRMTNDNFIPRPIDGGPTYRAFSLPCYASADTGCDNNAPVHITGATISNMRSGGISVEGMHDVKIDSSLITDGDLIDMVPVTSYTRASNVVTVVMSEDPHWLTGLSVAFYNMVDSTFSGSYSVTRVDSTHYTYTQTGQSDGTTTGGYGYYGSGNFVELKNVNAYDKTKNFEMTGVRMVLDKYTSAGACFALTSTTDGDSEPWMQNILVHGNSCGISDTRQRAVDTAWAASGDASYQKYLFNPLTYSIANYINAHVQNFYEYGNVWAGATAFDNDNGEIYNYTVANTTDNVLVDVRPNRLSTWQVGGSFTVTGSSAVTVNITAVYYDGNISGGSYLTLASGSYEPGTYPLAPVTIQACGNSTDCNDLSGDPIVGHIRVHITASTASVVSASASVFHVGIQ